MAERLANPASVPLLSMVERVRFLCRRGCCGYKCEADKSDCIVIKRKLKFGLCAFNLYYV